MFRIHCHVLLAAVMFFTTQVLVCNVMLSSQRLSLSDAHKVGETNLQRRLDWASDWATGPVAVKAATCSWPLR